MVVDDRQRAMDHPIVVLLRIEPDSDDSRLGVDTVHHRDLPVLLWYVSLVDTDGVGPEHPLSPSIPKA